MTDSLDLNELNEALAALESELEWQLASRVDDGDAWALFIDNIAEVVAAARQYAAGILPLDFPSDEDVEIAMKVIYQGTYQGHRDRQGLLDHTRAALQAVADTRRTEETK